jgi:GT2 family glycosyltransferase
VSVAAPAISVVVPSHERRLRLRWLLNALEAQTLAGERWEVVVVHDYDDRDTQDTLDRHPLAAAGRLRHVRIEPGTGSAARQRNLGWRAARAPLIAFTDDDCRPDAGWLEQLLAVAELHPGAVVQGQTVSDPLEVDVYASPHYRTVQEFDPPGRFAQTCNILYPRELLERIGGFDEGIRAPAGEDLDLNLRARAAGADYVGAVDALVYHCVEGYTLIGALRLARKWGEIAALVKRHPELRRTYPLRIFWRATHLRLVLAALGLGSMRRHPALGVLALPYLDYALRQRGTRPRARLASAIELPGRVVVDAAEVGILVRGSIRNRTLVL